MKTTRDHRYVSNYPLAVYFLRQSRYAAFVVIKGRFAASTIAEIAKHQTQMDRWKTLVGVTPG